MWYYKVVIGILLFPWSLILVMAVGAARMRYARRPRVIVLPTGSLPAPSPLPVPVPESAPVVPGDLETSGVSLA